MKEPSGQSQQELLSSIRSDKSLQPSGLISTHGGISFDSIIDRIGFGKYHIKLFFILGLLGMADGSEALVISFIVPVFQDYFKPSFDLESILGTVIYGGYFIGSLLSGYFSDKYGRRRPVIYSNILMVIIGLISAYPFGSVVAFVALRGMFGIIVGFFSPLAYTILAEITPMKYRGKYMVLISIFYTFGELISCGIAILTLTDLTTGNWHALLAWSTVPAFVAWVCSIFLLDESPRHEMMIGNYENGIKVLNKMYNVNKGTTKNPVSVMTPEEEQKLINLYKNKVLKKPKETVKESERLVSTFKELFKGNNKKITPFVWLNWFAQTLTYYGITYILPTTLSELNLSDDTDGGDVSSVIYSCLFELPSVIIAALIVDVKYFGRRNSLALSFLFGGIVSALAGFKIWPGFVIWVSFSKFFFNLAFAMNYQLTSEVYPTKARGTGLGLATAFGRLGSIIMPSISTWLASIAILAPYWVYGGAAILAGLGTWLIPIDTSNLQMDALDRTFEIDGI